MRRALLATGALILLVSAGGILFLMHSEAALQWMIARAAQSVSGLSIQSATGTLSGPLKIEGIRYDTGESSLGINEFILDWKPSRLLLFEAHISGLNAEGVTITGTGDTAAAKPAADLPEVNIPVAVTIKKAVISNISIMQNGGQEPVNIHSFSFRGRMDRKAVRIDQLDLAMPGFAVTATGKVVPRGSYPLRIHTSWMVRIPDYEEISGRGEITGTVASLQINQETASPFHSGVSMKITDITKSPAWEGHLFVRDFNSRKLNRTWPELSFSADVSGYGSATNADISTLSIRTLDGIVRGKGSASWGPYVSWLFTLESENLNPGIQWPEWPGSVDMTVHSAGHYEKGMLTVNQSELSAEGRLRDRLLKARAYLSATNSQVDLSGLEVISGGSSLSASGKVADTLSLKWKAHIDDAGDLIPGAQGVIEGTGSVTGSKAHPVIRGTINGRAVSYHDYRAERVTAVADIDTEDARESLLDVQAVNLVIDGQEINTLSLKSGGMVSSHSFSMNAAMDNRSTALSLTGGYKAEAWTGRLNSAVFDAGKFGKWSLREPVSLSASKGGASSGLLCAVSNDTVLCIQASWARAEGAMGTLSLTNVPLSTVKAFLPLPAETEGLVSGNGDIRYGPDGTMSGKLSLIMPSGKVYYRADDEPVDVPIGRSRADIVLNERALDAAAEIIFLDRGHIKGEISLPGFKPGKTAVSEQPISGHVAAEMNNLDLIPVFVQKVNRTSGSVAAQIRLDGTLAETAIAGGITLREGAADIPDLGLRVSNINLTMNGDESGTFTIEGRLSSGTGHMSIQGTLGLHRQKSPSAVLKIQGNDFEAVKTPGTWVIISPDVDVRIEDSSIAFEGSLKIPQARIEPSDTSGAVSASRDVTVVDHPAREKEVRWSVTGRLDLSLGDNVEFSGYGLTCRVTGGIHVTEQPGKVTQGRGEFQITDGKYSAYGQELAIEKGRLIFVGPIDDPGLDIRAVRKIKDVTAGVNVQGTLRTPEFHVYSVPSMDESDALSYILFGRPMRQLSGSEGNLLYGAAISGGLSAGGFVAKKIGAAFGVEDIEIEKGDTPEQTALFIGKYLSPRLYVNYGIGLFTPVSIVRLRYDLTRRLQLQTEHGLESGGDILYTIER